MGKERCFYLSKLKDIEYIFNERNRIVSNGELKDIVNKILYAKNEIEIEIDKDFGVIIKNLQEEKN